MMFGLPTYTLAGAISYNGRRSEIMGGFGLTTYTSGR